MAAKDGKKNYCLLLSNMAFSGGQEDLFAYQKDVESIKNVFSKVCNFELLHENDKTAEEMERIVERWSEIDFSNSDCLILFILSHGKENGIIFGTDEEAITVDCMQKHLDDIDDLKGKPKIIFVQACRGILKPYAEDFNVASETLSKKRFPDFFIYYSKSEDHVSYVHKENGTFFIKSICDMLEQKSCNQGLDDLVIKVNEAVSKNLIRSEDRLNILSPEVSHTLSKDFKLGFNLSKSSSTLPEYHVTNKNPCIILVNTKCSTHESICKMFNQKLLVVVETFHGLNFDVQVCLNLSNLDIKTKFNTELESKDYSKADCFATVILSCGCRRGNDDLIYGSNGLFCHIDTILNGICKNKTLLGKPKVIFLMLNDCTKLQYQKYTNTEGNHPSIDYQTAGGVEKIGKRSDTFRYCFLGTKKKELSLFMENLCNALTKSAKDGLSLTKTVFKVNESMIQDSTLNTPPELSHTLTKEVFLHNVDHGEEYCITEFGINHNQSAINKHTRDELKGIRSTEKRQDFVKKEKDVLLKDLKPRHIAQVAKYLDKFEPPLKNWTHLAEFIFHDDAERLALVSEMKIRYIGGSGGKSLLDNLNASRTLMTVDDFAETAENLDRMDIVDLFNDLSGDTCLKNIEPMVREKLINLLDTEGDASVKNWRSFVTELDLNEDEVFAFIRKGGSPTKELMKIVNSVNVNFTLDELRSCLENIGRMDVDAIVSNIIDDIQSKKKK